MTCREAWDARGEAGRTVRVSPRPTQGGHMARKKRKMPAKAPLIHPQVDSEVLPEDGDPLRPDPDGPPLAGPTMRPSIYSEWLNSNAPRPSVESAWLNSPTLTVPPSTAGAVSAQRAPAPAEPASTAPATASALPTASAPAAQDMRRGRRSTRARRLTAAERLTLDPDILGPITPVTSLPPVPPLASEPARSGRSGVHARRDDAPEDQPRPTHALPAAGDQPPAKAPRRTAGRLPATLGETTSRIAVPPTPTGGPALAARRATAMQRAAKQQPTEAQLSLTRQDTALDLSAQSRPAGALAQPAAPADASILIRGARHPRPSGRVVPKRLRPPSILMQGFVAAATVVVLLGALTISSPLGYGAAISGTFQSYANAVAWVPTPTPTATPAPVPPRAPALSYAATNPGTQAVVNDIKAVFGGYAQSALAVSHCESGWDPLARNPFPVGNSHAEGVFQILYPSTWDTTSYASQSPYNYDANIHAAYQIFSRDGFSWREWQCQP